MIEVISDLPDNVLGFRGRGKITAKDYESVLIPAVEEGFRKRDRLRLLYALGDDVEGYSLGAMWEDAKVGMSHLTSWDRIAVVTDIDSIEGAIKAVAFALPCEVRVYANDGLQEARAWISEPAPTGDLSFVLSPETHVLILGPSGHLEAADFERVASAVDPFIERTGGLRGLMIVAEAFPGWEDFSAFVSHLRFIKDHHRKIGRVAVVTDDNVVSIAPRLLRHFVAADVRRFPSSNRDEALAWVSERPRARS